MKRLPEGVSARSFSLQYNSNFKKVTIRNGFLWGRNENNHFVHVNLNNRENLVVKEFSDIGEIEFYSVSPNGEMCYIKTKSPKPLNYIADINNCNELRQINLLPNYVARTSAWLSFKDKAKPYLFFYVEEPKLSNYIQLCYFNLNSPIAFCVPVKIKKDGSPIPGQVLAFNLYQYDNQKIGASFIIYNKANQCQFQLYPVVFQDETFMPVEDTTCNLAYLPLGNFTARNKYFMENQYIGISTTPKAFFAIVRDPSKDVSILNMHHGALNFNIDSKSNYIFMSNNIIFQFFNQKLYIFLISANDDEPIDCIQLYNDMIFELDTYASNLYSISKNKITSYQFSSRIPATGFDSFRFWLYFRLIKKQKMQAISAAATILLQSSASFDQKFNLARDQSDSFRLIVFKKLLESVKDIYPVQRSVIAAMALDIYVRKETSEKVNNKNKEEKEAEIKDFIIWAKHLITDKILTTKIIEKTLIQYNWNEALDVFLQPPAAFELNMELGQYDEARKRLKQIQQSEIFGYSALRLHSLVPKEDICKDIKERDDTLNNGALIPLLYNENYLDHLKQLFSSQRPATRWLQSLFCIYMSKLPDSLCINQYFKKIGYDKEIMMRSLLSSKRYSEVAHGICSIENSEDLLPLAVSIYSKVSPQEAFELIPEDAPLPLKRRCALIILRSLKREDAEVVAQKSLLNSISGIDAATLIEYMPQTTTVGKLSKAIKRYANRNLIIEDEEKKKSAEALEGIKNSNQLVEKKEAQVFKLYKYSICYHCQRPLLNEPGIVYPCSHAFHVQCALEFFNNFLFVNPTIPSNNDINNKNTTNSNNNFSSSTSFDLSDDFHPDLASDCPLCGFLSIKMINHPFEPGKLEENQISSIDSTNDEWETDGQKLSKFLK